MTPRSSTTKPQTTRARLQAIIKESRQIMRKDAGLNGELDRLPQLAWLMFLRAFDEVEEERQSLQPGYVPAIQGNYRWRVWAADVNKGATGEPLIKFVNEQLLPYLRDLKGSGAVGDPRDTLASIFAHVQNRMLSGYLLRELVNQVSKIDFANTDDVHTMAHLYESMLKEMRDAAGDSGEFYTPRPLVRLITKLVDPQVGETVMDPAMGTGGFLVESFEHLIAQTTTAKQRELVKASLRGTEKKSLPFLLAQMNFLLHEINQPQLVQTNALANQRREMRRDGVDVILTNPPFGGEEEKSIPKNFEIQTAETVWLFLQAVMARLEKDKGRCGIVVPNSVLFDQGIGGRVKAALMKEFNLHTVLRLPNGVFAPYTVIPSNVLFFDHGKQQDEVWFYEHPMPEGRKQYTKTKPMTYEELEPIEQWWGGRERVGREANERAWSVPVADIIANGYNLDLHNPNRPDDLAHRPPAELIAELIDTERELLGLLRELETEIKGFEL